jgi:spore maturation protein CgeB
MKVLIAGPVPDFEINYNQSIARAFQSCGFSTHVLDYYVTTPPGFTNRLRIDLPLLFGVTKYYDRYVQFFNDKLLSTYKEFRPDLVLMVRGCKAAESTLKAMASSVRVIWFQDAVQRSGDFVRRSDSGLDLLHHYQHVFVFEASDAPWLAKNHGVRANFLPMAFDPDVHHPVPAARKDIDVFFVGFPYPKRRVILERLVEDFPDRNLRFYGRYLRYKQLSSWKRYVRYASNGYRRYFINKTVNPRNVNGYYARSKICINIHHDQSNEGCNPRVFEIMGAGAFQLVDDIPYVRGTMSDVLTTYEDYHELRSQIAYYLDHEVEREASARRGYEFALRNHTFLHRIKAILDHCGIR